MRCSFFGFKVSGTWRSLRPLTLKPKREMRRAAPPLSFGFYDLTRLATAIFTGENYIKNFMYTVYIYIAILKDVYKSEVS